MDTILMRHTNGQLRSRAKNYCLLTIMVVQAIITLILYLTKISMPLKSSISRKSIILPCYWAPDMLFFEKNFWSGKDGNERFLNLLKIYWLLWAVLTLRMLHEKFMMPFFNWSLID